MTDIDPARLEAAALSYKAFWAANLCSTARTEDMVSAILAADDRYRREHPLVQSGEDWRKVNMRVWINGANQKTRDKIAGFLNSMSTQSTCSNDVSNKSKGIDMSEDARITELATQLKTHHSGSYYTIEHWSYVARTAIEWLAANPSPQTDAAKEVSPTGITPSANPTSGGKVEQDAAGEEREPELPPKWRFGDYGHKKAYWYTPEGDDLTYTHADAHVEVNRCDAHELEAIARHMRYRKRLQDKREKETVVTDAMCDAFRKERDRQKIHDYDGAYDLAPCIAAALKAKP